MQYNIQFCVSAGRICNQVYSSQICCSKVFFPLLGLLISIFVRLVLTAHPLSLSLLHPLMIHLCDKITLFPSLTLPFLYVHYCKCFFSPTQFICWMVLGGVCTNCVMYFLNTACCIEVLPALPISNLSLKLENK